MKHWSAQGCDFLADWQEILQLQLSENPPRLTVEEATILYNEAEQNELLHAGLLLRRKRVPGNKVTYLVAVSYTHLRAHETR